MAIMALQSASSALSALNTSLDVIANNLANTNTNGFKASRANFQDLMYVQEQQPGIIDTNGDQRPIGLYVGLGVRLAGTQVDFTPGSSITTNSPLDMNIDGQGFFRVKVDPQTGDGFAYTRNGSFTLNKDGDVVMANDTGRRIDPPLTIPEDATGISINTNGEVFVQQVGQVAPKKIGDIKLSTFINPQGLRQLGGNLFAETDASGKPTIGQPGTDQRGTILQNQLEASNVDPTTELINMIRTQRAFEMNSNTIRTADSILQNIANLKR